MTHNDLSTSKLGADRHSDNLALAFREAQVGNVLPLDTHLRSSSFWVINTYHDTDFHASLGDILNIEMDLQIPTIIGGDFNTHSRTWSPPGIQPSPWADRLEDWAA